MNRFDLIKLPNIHYHNCGVYYYSVFNSRHKNIIIACGTIYNYA